MTWGKRWFYKYKGERGSIVHREEIKWFLNVLTDISVEFI